MAATERPRLLRRSGASGEEWDPYPPRDGAIAAAHEYFGQRLAAALRTQNISPQDLADAFGGTVGAWRHKFNGTRLWTLEDAIGVVLAFAIPLPDPYWRPGGEPSLLLPAEYRDRLQGRRGRLPELSDEPRWLDIAQQLDTWLQDEQEAGRELAVSAAAAFHRVLVIADRLGLPSRQATFQAAASTEARPIVVHWPARDTSVALYWKSPGSVPDGSSWDRQLSGALDAVVDGALGRASVRVAITVTPSALTANLRALFGDAGAVRSSSDLKRVGALSGEDGPPATIELHTVGKFTCLFRIR